MTAPGACRACCAVHLLVSAAPACLTAEVKSLSELVPIFLAPSLANGIALWVTGACFTVFRSPLNKYNLERAPNGFKHPHHRASLQRQDCTQPMHHQEALSDSGGQKGIFKALWYPHTK